MPEETPSRPPGPGFDKIENFNFLLSRTDPSIKPRHYSFDADTGLVPFANVNMEYDQTEGMGGLSVSSFDSVEDERGSLDFRGYPYGTFNRLGSNVASLAPSRRWFVFQAGVLEMVSQESCRDCAEVLI